MDHSKTITHVSLCAGYGGIDLGLKRAIPDLRTVAFSEIESFAVANLVSKMEEGLLDPAPVWTDLKTFPWGAFHGRVDILSGGYPCQPFSAAGKRLGKDDPRHLWPVIADGIRAMRPSVCFFENVEGHISLGLREVIGELEAIGYSATWGIFSAAEVGAPHQRKRVFILAHRVGERGLLSDWGRRSGGQMPFGNGETRGDELADARHSNAWGWPESVEKKQPDASVCNGFMGNAKSKGMEGAHNNKCSSEWLQSHIIQSSNNWPSRPGQPQHGWEPPRVVASLANTSSVRCVKWQYASNLDESSEKKQEYEQGISPNGLVGCNSNAAMGSADCGRQSFSLNTGSNQEAISGGQGDIEPPESRQTEPPLGGDADGATHRLDYAELYTSCDNRTDELRLLGNGVVPATAELAFRTLINRLTK